MVLAIGTPIGTPPSGSSSRQVQCVTSTDASVGPYRLCTSARLRSRNRRTTAEVSASPLHTTRRSAVHPETPGSSAKTASIDGTKCAVVTRCSAITPAR